MKEYLKYLAAAALLLLFLPFLLTVLLSGKESVEIRREPDAEMLLPVTVCREVPEEAPEALLQAQAILARSRLLAEDQKKNFSRFLEENMEYEQQYRMSPEFLERCRQAVADTAGLVLTVGGKAVEAPYFSSGSGKTRDGGEAMGTETYAWIVSVDSSADTGSPDYSREIRMSEKKAAELLGRQLYDDSSGQKEIFSQLAVLSTDSAGYVTEMEVGGSRLSGEKFRQILGLPSSCFTVQEEEGELIFLCRGRGHGLGMSQYGAAAMAREGKTAEEILMHYFPQASVTQIQD